MEDKDLELDDNLEKASDIINEANDDVIEDVPINWTAEIFDWIDTILYAMVAIITVFTFITRVSSVDGPSMNPTLEDKDWLLISNTFVPPERNSIVVAWADKLPSDTDDSLGKPVVKRIIAVPGDTIDMDFATGIVYLNGEELPLEVKDGVLYEDGHPISSYTTVREDFEGPMTIPEGYYFVMGDNRINSTDSRSEWIGLVDARHIIGRAYLRVAPFDRFGGIY